MASSTEFIAYVCEQLRSIGEISSRKMFGEYMVYVNAKPIVLVCDDTVYLKCRDCLKELMRDCPTAPPYEGAGPHYVLDIDDREFACTAVSLLERETPVPVKRNRAAKKR